MAAPPEGLTAKLIYASEQVRRLRADQNRDTAKLVYWIAERDHLLEQLSAAMKTRSDSISEVTRAAPINTV